MLGMDNDLKDINNCLNKFEQVRNIVIEIICDESDGRDTQCVEDWKIKL